MPITNPLHRYKWKVGEDPEGPFSEEEKEKREPVERDENGQIIIPRRRVLDLYEILGLDDQATQDQIRAAYKKKALKHHPGTYILLLHLSSSYHLCGMGCLIISNR